MKRPTGVRKMVVAAVGLALALTACSSEEVRTETVVDGRTVFVINDLSDGCDDTGACAQTWTINVNHYVSYCGDDNGAEASALYAVAGKNFRRGSEAWTLEGHDPSSLLLVPQESPCARPTGAGRQYLSGV